MMKHGHIQQTVRCQVCGKDLPADQAVPVDLVRESLIPTLKSKTKAWDPEGYVGMDELNKARLEHVEVLLKDDEEDMMLLKQEVVKSLEDHELLSTNVDKEFEVKSTPGERMADKVAAFGGSWTFIIAFGVVLFIWIIVNSITLFAKPFDPYPFIFLNLILSCVAAIQAPVIMMSQNRQETKDRMRGENDYKVNLKAELEVRHLNEKIDRLLNDQWKHLLEIQQMQLDMLGENTKGKANGTKKETS